MKKFRVLLAAMLAFVFNSGVWAQQFVADGDTYEVISGTNECRLVKLAGGTRLANLASSSQVYNQSNNQWYTVTTISDNIVADCKTTLEWIAMPSKQANRQNGRLLRQLDTLVFGHLERRPSRCMTAKKS